MENFTLLETIDNVFLRRDDETKKLGEFDNGDAHMEIVTSDSDEEKNMKR